MTRKRLSAIPQYLAPQRALTQLAGKLSECKWRWFKNWQINHLIKRYGVDIDAAQFTSVDDYPTFNSFFTRLIKPALRPIVERVDAVASPADGTISQIGTIDDNSLLQAKGFHFNLTNLMGGFTDIAQHFQYGKFATIYLAPKDYHRVHMPIEGALRETIFIPGKLFSVNKKTAESVPNLFARNERLVCLFDTSVGPVAVILVGAMLVGSICTIWEPAGIRSKKILRQSFIDREIHLKRGEEMGHFKMGSTVILLFPKNTVEWSPQLESGTSVHMGEFFGKINFS